MVQDVLLHRELEVSAAALPSEADDGDDNGDDERPHCGLQFPPEEQERGQALISSLC